MIKWQRLTAKLNIPCNGFQAACALAAVFITVLAALSIAVLQAQELPAGAGKDALQTVCTKCHEMGQVTAKRRTATDWSMTVDKMITQGATATEEQFNAILDYLITNFRKPMNVNLASPSSLASEFGFSGPEAESLVAYRNQHGPFESLEDLKKTPGLDAAKVDASKEWIAFQ